MVDVRLTRVAEKLRASTHGVTRYCVLLCGRCDVQSADQLRPKTCYPDLPRLLLQLLKRIKEGGLTAAFLDEGCRFEKLLRTFPLFLVTNEQVGLLGAREYAIKLLTMPGACKQSDINE